MLKASLFPNTAQLAEIAKESKLVQRRSARFSPSGFLLALLQSVVKGDTSINQIAMHLGAFQSRSMSRQALHQRLGPATSEFLVRVINSVLRQKNPKAAAALRDAPFRRVLIEDTTVISMAKRSVA